MAVKSSILDKDAVHRVVSLLLEAEAAVEPSGGDSSTDRSGLRVIDAFIIPKFCYDPIKKVFYEYAPFFSYVLLYFFFSLLR